MTTATIANLAPITAKATAALARKELKASFPGIKFSVRSDAFGFNSLSIRWENGPTKNNVEATLAKFIGVNKNFDYMQDMYDAPTYVDNGSGSYYEVSTIWLTRN